MKRNENTTTDPEAWSLYSLLPSLNDLLLSPHFAVMLKLESHSTVVRSTRAVLFNIRQEIAEGQHTPASLNSRLAGLHLAVTHEISQNKRYSLRRVINATGVILHTNLGRAPLSGSALSHIVEIAAGYSNLELDLDPSDTHADYVRRGLREWRERGGLPRRAKLPDIIPEPPVDLQVGRPRLCPLRLGRKCREQLDHAVAFRDPVPGRREREEDRDDGVCRRVA